MQSFILSFMSLMNHMCLPSHRWTKAHDLLVEQKIRKDRLATAVKESDAMLRWENLLKNI